MFIIGSQIQGFPKELINRGQSSASRTEFRPVGGNVQSPMKRGLGQNGCKKRPWRPTKESNERKPQSAKQKSKSAKKKKKSPQKPTDSVSKAISQSGKILAAVGITKKRRPKLSTVLTKTTEITRQSDRPEHSASWARKIAYTKACSTTWRQHL